MWRTDRLQHTGNIKGFGQGRSAATLDVHGEGRVVDFDKDFHLTTGLVIGCIGERRPHRIEWQKQWIAQMIGVRTAGGGKRHNNKGKLAHIGPSFGLTWGVAFAISRQPSKLFVWG